MTIAEQVEQRLAQAAVVHMRRRGVALSLDDPTMRRRAQQWAGEILNLDIDGLPPDLHQLGDDEVEALVVDGIDVVQEFLDMVYGQMDADLPSTRLLVLAQPWEPERHPRWPKGTPGVTRQGHPLAGKFMETPDLFDRLRHAISGTADMTFLAHGATHIERLTASAGQGGVEIDATMRDGSHRKIGVPRDNIPTHEVLDAVARVENDARGEPAPAAAAAAGAGAPSPAQPHAQTPGAPNEPFARGTRVQAAGSVGTVAGTNQAGHVVVHHDSGGTTAHPPEQVKPVEGRESPPLGQLREGETFRWRGEEFKVGATDDQGRVHVTPTAGGRSRTLAGSTQVQVAAPQASAGAPSAQHSSWANSGAERPAPGSDPAVRKLDKLFANWDASDFTDSLDAASMGNDMNTVLRGQGPENPSEADLEVIGEAQQMIDDVRNAIEAAPPLPAITVWRATTLEGLGVNRPEDLSGKTVSDKGFTSVTVDRHVAEWFASDPSLSSSEGETVLIRINLPAGQKAAWLKPHVSDPYFDADELLLPDGMTFKFGKVTRDAQGRPIVTATPVRVDARAGDVGNDRAAPEAPRPPAFDTATWAGKPVPDRVSQFQALAPAEREALADPTHTIPARIDELVGPQQADVNAEIAHIQRAGLMDTAIFTRLKRASVELRRHLTDAGASQADADRLTQSFMRYMAAQEAESQTRTLGDHGLRHLLGDSEMATSIIDEVPGNDSPADYALFLLAGAFHDAGYLTPPSRIFLDKDHPEWSTTNYDGNLRDQVLAALGEQRAETLRHMIETHAGTEVNWEDDALGSAFRLADNLALFHDEKMPPVVFHVPANAEVLARFGAGDISVDEARAEMRRNIAAAPLPDAVKARLETSLNELSPFLPKNALGMLGGRIESFKWRDGHLKVNLHRDDRPDNLARVLDVGQRQFKKLAEAYLGEDGAARFRTENRLDLNHPSRGKVVEFSITGDPVPQPTEPTPIAPTTEIPGADVLDAALNLADLPPPNPDRPWSQVEVAPNIFIGGTYAGQISLSTDKVNLPQEWANWPYAQRKAAMDTAIAQRFEAAHATSATGRRPEPGLLALTSLAFRDGQGNSIDPGVEEGGYYANGAFIRSAYVALRQDTWNDALNRFPGVRVVGRIAVRKGWPLHPEAEREIRRGDLTAPHRDGHIPVNPEHIAAVDARLATLRPKFAAARGLTEDAYLARLAEHLDGHLAGRHVAVRVRARSMTGILRDGHLRPVSDVRTSGAGGVRDRRVSVDEYIESRSRFEQNVFGIPWESDTNPNVRPIYGYLTNGDPIEEDSMGHYGEVVLVLKPAVRDRATFTLGDSLDSLSGRLYAGVPMPLNAEPVERTRAALVSSEDYDPLDAGISGYIETQIHSDGSIPPVSLDDIAEIHYTGGARPSAAVRRELESRGIAWRTVDHGAPDVTGQNPERVAFARRADRFARAHPVEDSTYPERPEGFQGDWGGVWYLATHRPDAEGFFHLPPDVQRTLSPDGPPPWATYDEERYLLQHSRVMESGRYHRPPEETPWDRIPEARQGELRRALSSHTSLADVPAPEQAELRQLARDSGLDLSQQPSRTAAWSGQRIEMAPSAHGIEPGQRFVIAHSTRAGEVVGVSPPDIVRMRMDDNPDRVIEVRASDLSGVRPPPTPPTPPTPPEPPTPPVTPPTPPATGTPEPLRGFAVGDRVRLADGKVYRVASTSRADGRITLRDVESGRARHLGGSTRATREGAAPTPPVPPVPPVPTFFSGQHVQVNGQGPVGEVIETRPEGPNGETGNVRVLFPGGTYRLIHPSDLTRAEAPTPPAVPPPDPTGLTPQQAQQVADVFAEAVGGVGPASTPARLDRARDQLMSDMGLTEAQAREQFRRHGFAWPEPPPDVPPPPSPPGGGGTTPTALRSLAVGDRFLLGDRTYRVASTRRADGRITVRDTETGRVRHITPSRQVLVDRPAPPRPPSQSVVTIDGALWRVRTGHRADGRIGLVGPNGERRYVSPATLARLRGDAPANPPPTPPRGQMRRGQVALASEFKKGDVVTGASGAPHRVVSLSGGRITLQRLGTARSTSYGTDIPLRYLGRIDGNRAVDDQGTVIRPNDRFSPARASEIRITPIAPRPGDIARRADNEVLLPSAGAFDAAAGRAGIPMTASHVVGMFDSKTLKQKGLRVQLAATVSPNRHSVTVAGTFYDRAGNQVGSVTRRLDFSTKTVDHAYLSLNPTHRNGGITKDLFASMISVYHDLGMKKVKVHANIDVGGYAWGRYGFVSKNVEQHKQRVLVDMGRRIDTAVAQGRMTATQAREAKNAARRALEDVRDTIDLANLRIQVPGVFEGEQALSSKPALLGAHWHGTLDLAHGSKSWRQLVSYLGKKGYTEADLTTRRRIARGGTGQA